MVNSMEIVLIDVRVLRGNVLQKLIKLDAVKVICCHKSYFMF